MCRTRGLLKYFVHSIANFYFPYISSLKIRQAIEREQVAMHKSDDGGQLITFDKLSGGKYGRFEKDAYICYIYIYIHIYIYIYHDSFLFKLFYSV